MSQTISSHLLKRAELFVFCLAVFIICFALLFQIISEIIAVSPHYRNLLLRAIQENTGANIKASSAKLGWSWSGPFLNLNDVHWQTKEQTLFLKAKEVHIGYDPLGHIWGKPATRLEFLDGGVVIRSSLAPGESALEDLSLSGRLHNFFFVTEDTGGLIFLVKEGDFLVNKETGQLHITAAAHWQDLVAANLFMEISSERGVYVDIRDFIFLPGWQDFINELDLPPGTLQQAENIDNVAGSGKIWIKDEPSQKKRQVIANMDIQQLEFQNKAPITDLEFLTRWDYHLPTKNWELWLHNASGNLNQKSLSFPAAQIKKQDSSYAMKIKKIDLTQLTHLSTEFISNQQQQGNISAMDLKGSISDIGINIDTQAPPDKRFNMRARLHNVSIQPVKPAPGGFGISGYAHIEGNSGSLALDAKKSGIFIPEIYPEHLVFDRARGHFAWEWLPPDHLLLVGSVPDIQHQKQRASMELQLESIFAKRGYLKLLVGAEEVNTQQTRSYIPWLLFSEKTRSWLDAALIKSEVDHAALLLKTDIRAPQSSQNILELAVQAKDTVFLYDNLRGALSSNATDFLMDRELLDIALPYGVKSEAEIQADSAYVQMNTETNIIGINGTGNIKGSFLSGLINQYILAQGSITQRGPLEMQGNIDGAWNFEYALRERSLKDLFLDTQFKLESLYHPSMGEAAQNLIGDLSFSKAQGFRGDLKGNYTDSPVTGQFISQGKQNFLRLNSRLFPADFLPPQFSASLSGKAQTKIDLYATAKGDWSFNRLAVATDLFGVESNLPAPLAKSANKRIPLKLGLFQTAEEERIDIAVKNIATIKLQRQNEGAVSPSRPSELTASISAPVNLTAWRKYIWPQTQQIIQPAKAFNSLRRLQEDWELWDIYVQRVEIGDTPYRNLHIRQTPRKILHFTLGKSKGQAVLGKNRVDLNINNVYINKTDDDKGFSFPRLPNHLSFASMPAIHITIDHIVYDDLDAGNLIARISFTPKHMMAVLETNDFLGLRAEGEIDWTLVNRSRSQLNAFLTANGNLAPDAIRAINTDQMFVRANISWQEENYKFPQWLQTAQGEILFEADKGEFPGSRSLLINNMLSLLNIANLGSRFRGDFSDLSPNKMQFKELDIHLLLQDATINTHPDWNAAFGFGNMRMEGNYSLKTQKLDYLATVTPSVAQTLPISALLLGASSALPLLLSLEFSGSNDFINRFSSANYRITGNITDPVVRLVRLGDLAGQNFSPDELSEKALDIKSRLQNLSP